MNKRNLWASDPAACAKKIQQDFPETVRQTLQLADQYLKGQITFQEHWEMERCHIPVCFDAPPAGIRWDEVPFGDVEWLYALNRHTIFLTFAKAWQFTGDKKYPRALCAWLEDWIDRTPLCAESEENTWRSLEAGLRCEYWLRALCLVRKAGVISEALEKKVDECLWLHADYLLRKNGAFHRMSNWGILQNHGLFLLGVWYGRDDWIRQAIERLDDEFRCQTMGDGSHREQSPLYHCEVLHCGLDTLLVAGQNGIVLPEGLVDAVRRMCHALLAMMTPSGTLVCQSDSDAVDARDLLAQGALLFEDGVLAEGAGGLFEETYWDFGVQAQAAYEALPRKSAPLSMALPDSGNYMLRAGHAAGAAWVHFHCGSMGGGHGHADQLHLDAGVQGEVVLTDTGRYTYVEGEIRRVLKSPAAHNTLIVDGKPFTQYAGTWGWKNLAWYQQLPHFFSTAASCVGGTHLGYLDLGIVTSRKVVWLPEWDAAVIFDEFVAGDDTPHEFAQYFHFAQGRLEGGNGVFSWQGARAQARLHCLGNVESHMEPCRYSQEYNKLMDGTRLEIRRTQAGFGWFVSVLDLHQGEPLEAELVPVQAMEGTLLSDRQIQAVCIKRGEKEGVAVLRHGDTETFSGGYCVQGKSGVGRLCWLENGCPAQCLMW